MVSPKETHLTGREQQVIELIGRGMTNAEIAASLTLSHWTIKRHIARILAKTGSRRRIDLAVQYRPADRTELSGETDRTV
jgi:DNA-binding NarL/FixJ family response regulator